MSFFEILYQLLKLTGALGLFLYGMKLMSEALQKVAGKNIRNVIIKITSTNTKSVFFGIIITAIIQSSSATTVMLVSFVNAGLINLSESVFLMMGANIGTTLKIWLITLLGVKFNISMLLLPLIGICLPFIFSAKGQKRYWGEFVVGFVLLFLGIDFMMVILPDFHHSTYLTHFIQEYNHQGIGTNLIFVFIGLFITAIVQSSSATITMTIIMSLNNLITYEHAAALVLGENIGTTITANLAAIIANKSAKKTALSHTIFNISGIIWAIPLFSPFLNLIDWMVQKLTNISAYSDTNSIPLALCFFHSFYNIINTLIWFNFTKILLTILNFIIPDKKKKEKFKLKDINTGLLSTSEVSIKIAQTRIVKLGKNGRDLIEFIPQLLIVKDEKDYNNLILKTIKTKDKIDKQSLEIRDFIVSISKNDISEKSSVEIASMFKIIENIENISNLGIQLSNIINDKNERKICHQFLHLMQP